MGDYTERPPLSKRGRIIVSVIGWVVLLGPLLVGVGFLMGWYALLIVLPSMWATWDYVRRGGGAEDLEGFLHRAEFWDLRRRHERESLDR